MHWQEIVTDENSTFLASSPSQDNTCVTWDLPLKIQQHQPVKTFLTNWLQVKAIHSMPLYACVFVYRNQLTLELQLYTLQPNGERPISEEWSRKNLSLMSGVYN